MSCGWMKINANHCFGKWSRFYLCTIFWKSEEIFENDCVLLHIHFAHEEGPRWPIGLSRNEISFQRKIKFVKFCNFQSLSPLVTTCGILLKILTFSKVSNFPFKPASHTGANTMVNLTIINILYNLNDDTKLWKVILKIKSNGKICLTPTWSYF